MRRKSTRADDILELIKEIKKDPMFSCKKVFYSAGEGGDLLSDTLKDDLKLKPISADELPFYSRDQVLVIGEYEDRANGYKQFEEYGYQVFLLNI